MWALATLGREVRFTIVNLCRQVLIRFPQGYISDGPGKTSFWQVEHYQSYFDVDTHTVRSPVSSQNTHALIETTPKVIRRCYSTLVPSNTSFLSTHLSPPDLYGPFWTLTTLIFSLFVFSSLASSIAAYLSDPNASSPTDPLEYNFGLLSIAMGLVYSYGLAVPILLWLGLRYLGVGEWSVVETVALWGYGQFVWIPVSVSTFSCLCARKFMVLLLYSCCV
jgi:protein YIPF1/2